AAAAPIHVCRDDVHLPRRGSSGFGGVDVFKWSAAGNESMPHDVRVPKAAQLFLEPVDRIAVALGSLYAIAELRAPLDVPLVPAEFETAPHLLQRLWRHVGGLTCDK